MKIAIDAHNLGLKEGSGIANYARNLAQNLMVQGHNVFPIYAMPKTFMASKLNAPSFFQSLATKGEAGASNYQSWYIHMLRYIFTQSIFMPQRLQNIHSHAWLNIEPLRPILPQVTGFFNAPSLYRSAQAIASLTGMQTHIRPPQTHNIDVLHLTMPLPISMKGTKKIVTMHDLIPLLMPTSTAINLVHYLTIIKTSLKQADLIFSVSEQTKKDIVRILNVPDDKIFVTHQSSIIPKAYLQITKEDITHFLKLYNLEAGKYFLFYGAIEPKKNLAALLNAFTMAKTGYKLVIVGKNGWLFDDVDKFFQAQKYSQKSGKRYDQKVIRISYAPFRNLMYLLKGARALIFPSSYEGFGLPVLEALQMGCPVITSHAGALPEVGGDAVHYVDPFSIEDIKSSIEMFSGNDEKLASLVKRGKVQAKKFSAQNYQAKLAEGYNMLMR